MASARNSRADSFARFFSVPDDRGITFEEAIVRTKDKKRGPLLSQPIVKNLMPEDFGPDQTWLGNFPMVPAGGSTKLAQWMDFVHPYEGPRPYVEQDQHEQRMAKLKELEGIAMSNYYENYPDNLKPANKSILPFTMQTFITKNPDNTRSLLKLFTREKDNEIKYSDAFQMCHGSMYKVDYGKHFRDGSRALQYLFERLPGFQVRYYAVVDSCAPKRPTDVQLPKGFEYIKEHGPKSNMDNAALEFAEIACDDPESPIYGWPKSLVERSCLNRGKSAAAAREQTFKHLTLWDIRGWFLMCVLAPILGSWRRKSFIFLGESGFGKSPLAKVLAMLFSMRHVENDNIDEEPGFRLCNSFEHLRHEVGEREVTEVFDDGDLEQQGQAKLKAFHDDAEREAVRPSFNANLSKKNLMALFKRSNLVQFDKRGVFARPAGIEEVPVPFIACQIEGKPDILTDECKEHCGNFLENGNIPAPDDYDEKMAWSMAYLKVCMAGQTPPPIKTAMTRSIVNASRGSAGLYQNKATVVESRPTTHQLENMLASSGSAGAQPTEAAAEQLEQEQLEQVMRQSAEAIPLGPGEWQGRGAGGVAVKEEKEDSPRVRGRWGKRLAPHTGPPINITDSSQSPNKLMKTSNGDSRDEDLNLDEVVGAALEDQGEIDAAPPAAAAAGDGAD
ncbi:unnamed protein product [Prorocentrum cordatum]|uniref:Uncharacterized protein n=1 Tax=Prorocentrum cordatum TaxID=2364126 RepID=A0ABN9RBE8_9DINO|nr:unnamed protein product [Polarella glacialis]